MTEGEAVSCHSMRQRCEVISALGPCWEGECVCPFVWGGEDEVALLGYSTNVPVLR